MAWPYAELNEHASVVGRLDLILGKDALWKDEFSYTQVLKQGVRLTLDGTLVVEYVSAPPAGNPITLDTRWQSKAIIDQLIFIRDRATENQRPMRLILCDGRIKYVIWDHNNSTPIEVAPILERPDYINQVSPDWYNVILHFLDAYGLA
jgi:hypothetical protein